MFCRGSLMEAEQLPGGVSRKVQARGGNMMLVEITFAQGEDKTPGLHTHPHEQTSYVVSGRVRFMMGDKQMDLSAGDSLYIPGNVPHGAQPLTDGAVALDIFTPIRQDLLPGALPLDPA